MAQNQTLGRTATSTRTELTDTGTKRTIIRYHNTDVVEFTASEIVLRTGGWKTVTTKLRMNQASNQFGLDYSVFQKNHEWFVSFKGILFPFNGDNRLLVR